MNVPKHKHEYYTNEDGQEECKKCGLLKSTIEGVKNNFGSNGSWIDEAVDLNWDTPHEQKEFIKIKVQKERTEAYQEGRRVGEEAQKYYTKYVGAGLYHFEPKEGDSNKQKKEWEDELKEIILKCWGQGETYLIANIVKFVVETEKQAYERGQKESVKLDKESIELYKKQAKSEMKEELMEWAKFKERQKAIRYPEYIRGINNCAKELIAKIKSL